MLVSPIAISGRPAVTTTRSPGWNSGRERSALWTARMPSSVWRSKGTRTGSVPHESAIGATARRSSVKANSGTSGRKLATARAVEPECVRQAMALAPTSSARRTAVNEIAWVTRASRSVTTSTASRPPSRRRFCSAERTISSITSTARMGYLPAAVSPDSMTASEPSKTAFATSLASARVGRGLSIIDSSIWVAVMTGLEASRHARIRRFCTIGTSCIGISMPRSPRATITPSESSRMAPKSSTASGFSIFDTTGVAWPASAMRRLRSATSAARRTNESATRSTCWLRPKARSSRSFVVRLGRELLIWGRLTPLRLRIGPPTTTSV